jgi:hypothetical protein
MSERSCARQSLMSSRRGLSARALSTYATASSRRFSPYRWRAAVSRSSASNPFVLGRVGVARGVVLVGDLGAPRDRLDVHARPTVVPADERVLGDDNEPDRKAELARDEDVQRAHRHAVPAPAEHARRERSVPPVLVGEVRHLPVGEEDAVQDLDLIAGQGRPGEALARARNDRLERLAHPGPVELWLEHHVEFERLLEERRPGLGRRRRLWLARPVGDRSRRSAPLGLGRPSCGLVDRRGWRDLFRRGRRPFPLALAPAAGRAKAHYGEQEESAREEALHPATVTSHDVDPRPSTHPGGPDPGVRYIGITRYPTGGRPVTK